MRLCASPLLAIAVLKSNPSSSVKPRNCHCHCRLSIKVVGLNIRSTMGLVLQWSKVLILQSLAFFNSMVQHITDQMCWTSGVAWFTNRQKKRHLSFLCFHVWKSTIHGVLCCVCSEDTVSKHTFDCNINIHVEVHNNDFTWCVHANHTRWWDSHGDCYYQLDKITR